MKIPRLWRTGKRAVAIVLIGLTVGVLAVPETSLATPQPVVKVLHQPRPTDGQGDSPAMP